MSCVEVRELLSEDVDARLERPAANRVRRHLAVCRECRQHRNQLVQTRSHVRALARFAPAPPAGFRTRLLVAASHQRQKLMAPAGVLAWHFERFRLWLDNLVSPLAVPVTGGLLATALSFLILVPSVATQIESGIADVPLGIHTQATLKAPPPFSVTDDAVAVELLVDEQGRMIDCWLPVYKTTPQDARLRRSVENALLFSQFTPATTFGQPKWGRLRLYFSNSRIDVKG